MFDQMSANAITGLLPSLTYSLPYFGEVNFQRVVGAVIVFVVLTLGFWILRMIILTRARMLAEKTSGLLDDVVVDAIQNIRAWVYSLVALYAALQFFSFPTVVDKVFAGIFYFAIVWQAIEVASRFVEYFTTQYMEKDEDGDGINDNAGMKRKGHGNRAKFGNAGTETSGQGMGMQGSGSGFGQGQGSASKGNTAKGKRKGGN